MEQYIEILGTIVGIVYLWLEYKANIYLWLVSIIMPAIYLYVFYVAGLYADFAINIYYLLIAIYGWMAWKYGFKLFSAKREKNVDEKLRISHVPKKLWIRLVVVYVLLQLSITWVLITYTNSDVPWLDSFTTSVSILAMWLLARKYLEQWLVWIVVDIVSVGLYLYKDLYYTSALYAVYAIIAIFGYYKWKSIMQVK
ncbi:MAG: nicotinamide mononucleotide transporter [Muribaculaceae bacterium]|nr:nicotinamide mononucleotide transporter [Muribaculaceae bacterium]